MAGCRGHDHAAFQAASCLSKRRLIPEENGENGCAFSKALRVCSPVNFLVRRQRRDSSWPVTPV